MQSLTHAVSVLFILLRNFMQLFDSLAPSVSVNRVATYRQLDSDLHKHSGLFTLVCQQLPFL